MKGAMIDKHYTISCQKLFEQRISLFYSSVGLLEMSPGISRLFTLVVLIVQFFRAKS